MIARARKHASPLEAGKVRFWPGAALCAIGQVNLLFDPTQRQHTKANELSRLTGVSKSALADRDSPVHGEASGIREYFSPDGLRPGR